MKSVGIVGGGIIGLSTAAAILQKCPELKIVVYSDLFTPHTTADVSAGSILPYVVSENDDPATIRNWVNETVKHLLDFAKKNDDASGAITSISGYQLWKKMPKPEDKVNYFQNCLMGWRDVEQSELDRISSPGRYEYGVFCTAISCDCSLYLPCIMKNLAAKGVTFVEKKIISLNEVADLGHDIVVNTTGFFATYLTNDQEIRPCRGQTIVAKAPWIKHFYRERDGECYVYPKSDILVVGGTHDAEAALTLHKDVSNQIWKDAHLMVPNLKGGRVIGERVGIRPGRSSVRIEIEQAMTQSLKKYIVLHHYGHGGYGVTLHWGSAKEAASVLKKYLDQRSKL